MGSPFSAQTVKAKIGEGMDGIKREQVTGRGLDPGNKDREEEMEALAEARPWEPLRQCGR